MIWLRAALIACSALSGMASAQPAIVSEGPAIIASSRQFVLRSSHANRDFLIQVAEPVRKLEAGETAAVIYVMDGDYMFGMAADVARNLQIVREIAPAYVVAIGYPGDDHGDWVQGRLRDMIDDARELRGHTAGGGGRAFRRFVLDELRPFIEARYPVDRSRSFLHGHSLGGLFAATTLAERPDAFAGYAIGSPSIWVRPELMERVDRLARPTAARPNVYVGVGADEKDEDMAGWAAKLAASLQAKGFSVRHRAFDQEGHVSVEGVLFANALKFLVPPPPEPAKP